ncbi:hypothetical protein G6F31_021390 [Rhizopus arrhizus]|nr:hypothetical protein G6F31_021390 [Rhizopus arrhizus]
MSAMHAEQQVVQAVALLADHDQQAFLAARIVQLQVHAVFAGQRGQAAAQVVGGHGGGQVEVHAQEELARR